MSGDDETLRDISWVLARTPGLTQRQVANILAISTTRVQRGIAELRRRGWLGPGGEITMRCDEDERTLPTEEELIEIARAQRSRPGVHPPPKPADHIGYCWPCGMHRARVEAVSVVRDGCGLYTCVVCGAILDESPF